ncbi:MAG: hypothetical protein ACRDIL_19695 [Candidatus Limnocylindrales bacterium]
MLIESQDTVRVHEADPPADPAMLAFQYLTAIVAVAAAILLAFVH